MGYNPQEEKMLAFLRNNGYLSEDFVPKGGGLIPQLLEEKQPPVASLTAILAQQFQIHKINLAQEAGRRYLIDQVSHQWAKSVQTLAYEQGCQVEAAMANPFDQQTIRALQMKLGRGVIPVFATETELGHYIDRIYQGNIYIEGETSEASVIIDLLISSAINQRASDIHIEHSEGMARLRFRVDGHLKIHEYLAKEMASRLITRLKILANLDIADHRLPKDGGFTLPAYSDIDFRVSTLPTIFGEKVVIRLIYKNAQAYSLASGKLGFSPEDTVIIRKLLKHQTGAILVTGATGSGKSTTLSSFLNELNKEGTNITTVEDPVEHVISGVNHVNINDKIHVGFSTLLRNILRQDPDIIMIGEIRDQETAKMMIEASLTGHLCLSTLHTNDAVSTLSRLTDMGIEPYLLLEAIRGVISQRLVRRLCACKKAGKLPSWLAARYHIPPETTVYERQGCPACFQTGYEGRFAIYEILVINENEAAKTALLEGTYVMEKGTMVEKALEAVCRGDTSLEEIYGLVLNFGVDVV